MPEDQRWAFLRDKSVTVTVNRKGTRVRVRREFKGGNVEEKMTLAAKLGYRPA
jgi:HSP20 family molecular chaperone IbpA